MKRIKVEVTPRELDMILAALRLSQRPEAWLANYGQIDIQAIATEHGRALTNREIDRLCERLNA